MGKKVPRRAEKLATPPIEKVLNRARIIIMIYFCHLGKFKGSLGEDLFGSSGITIRVNICTARYKRSTHVGVGTSLTLPSAVVRRMSPST